MTAHPLLTRVLADAYHADRTGDWCDHDPHHELGMDVGPECVMTAEGVVAAIPPDVADRLGAALDVCVWEYPNGTTCGLPERDGVHCPPWETPDGWFHPFVPLVPQ